jgi:tRNA/tmRNA/rRNA uracil-C5-methylase (TrmA/RlmC/RlmD family)
MESKGSGAQWQAFKAMNPDQFLGWAPTCAHEAETVAGIVLDPFAGSGTTGVVATRRDRRFLGCDLNPEYVDLARARIRDDAPLFNTPAETVEVAAVLPLMLALGE